MTTAIEVDALGKLYRIRSGGAQYGSIRDIAARTLSAPIRAVMRRESANAQTLDMWALKDVSFRVAEGEVLGLVGRNGAGKSTMLKILSRITKPTEGRAVVRGRVGSLLEVGTGFHQELSGRENIFLNGAVLGMPRADIKRRFDEIVEFSGVEKYLDTPVKFYSSGMYIRLAFAVAAHLEPDVLIVDEVLAVGDAEFQKKCMGKMSSVAGEGRTVLFVSHNMVAVEGLCTRAILLQRGRKAFEGSPTDVLNRYMGTGQASAAVVDLSDAAERPAGISPVVQRVEMRDGSGSPTASIATGGRLEVTIEYDAGVADLASPAFALLIDSPLRGHVIHAPSEVVSPLPSSIPGRGRVHCVIDPLPLSPGGYTLGIGCRSGNRQIDLLEGTIPFEVYPVDVYGTGRLPQPENSVVVPQASWSVR